MSGSGDWSFLTRRDCRKLVTHLTIRQGRLEFAFATRDVAQVVERDLARSEARVSTLVSRSNLKVERVKEKDQVPALPYLYLSPFMILQQWRRSKVVRQALQKLYSSVRFRSPLQKFQFCYEAGVKPSLFVPLCPIFQQSGTA